MVKITRCNVWHPVSTLVLMILASLAVAYSEPVSQGDASIAYDTGQSVVKHRCTAGFVAGVDLSSLTGNLKLIDTFHAAGNTTQGLGMFKAHGYEWVRVRTLVPAAGSDATLQALIEYVRAARAARYNVLLDLHLSDRLADPSDQHTPPDWGDGQFALHRAVAYTQSLMKGLQSADALPDMIQIGNEINNGVLWPSGHLPEHWDFVAHFIRAEEQAITAALEPGEPPKFLIHVACGDLGCSLPFFNRLTAENIGIDVIGLSFYVSQWVKLSNLEESLTRLGGTFKKPIFIVETAYRWKPSPTSSIPAESSTPEGQRAFFEHVVKTVADSEWGCGVFWWEPTALQPDLIGRGLFDENRLALPAFYVIDHWRDPKLIHRPN